MGGKEGAIDLNKKKLAISGPPWNSTCHKSFPLLRTVHASSAEPFGLLVYCWEVGDKFGANVGIHHSITDHRYKVLLHGHGLGLGHGHG